MKMQESRQTKQSGTRKFIASAISAIPVLRPILTSINLKMIS
ncbi:MAG: hypothetical protein NDF55_00480 [archaeon GB-1867-005]|nr:hypothetical protein [Candidatus Culexmicrobium cathedralense]